MRVTKVVLLLALFTIPVNADSDRLADPALDQAKLKIYGAANTPLALDKPEFVPLDLAGFVGGLEPVIAVTRGTAVKAYPVRILAAHGVVNDEINGEAIAVTYCGPCAGATVVGRVIGGQSVEIEPSGAIYDGSLLLTDRASGTLWQQRDGRAVAGPRRGENLQVLGAQIISMARFRKEHGENPRALVLRDTALSRVPAETRMALPEPHESDIKKEDMAEEEVRIVGDRAWSLELLAQEKSLDKSNVIILWQPDSTFSAPPK